MWHIELTGPTAKHPQREWNLNLYLLMSRLKPQTLQAKLDIALSRIADTITVPLECGIAYSGLQFEQSEHNGGGTWRFDYDHDVTWTYTAKTSRELTQLIWHAKTVADALNSELRIGNEETGLLLEATRESGLELQLKGCADNPWFTILSGFKLLTTA